MLSRAGTATPFPLTALGYLLAGTGFGVIVPGVTHVAMRDVPAGASGAASGVVNASRQVGTSVGLAVLGSIGATATVSAWRRVLGRLPVAERAAARAQSQNVAAGHLGALTQALGPGSRGAAAGSFVSGYHLAVGVGAVLVLAAALVALTGFRQRAQTAVTEANVPT